MGTAFTPDLVRTRIVCTYSDGALCLCSVGQESVRVSHIRSPAQFYVQRCRQERQLQDLMRRVAQWCASPESQRDMHLLTLSQSKPTCSR